MKKKLIWTLVLIVIVAAMCFWYVIDEFRQPGVHTLWRFLHMDTAGTCYLIDTQTGESLGEATYRFQVDASDFRETKDADSPEFEGTMEVAGYEVTYDPALWDSRSGAAYLDDAGIWSVSYDSVWWETGQEDVIWYHSPYSYWVEFFADAPEHMVIWIMDGDRTLAAVPGESYEEALWAYNAFHSRKDGDIFVPIG